MRQGSIGCLERGRQGWRMIPRNVSHKPYASNNPPIIASRQRFGDLDESIESIAWDHVCMNSLIIAIFLLLDPRVHRIG